MKSLILHIETSSKVCSIAISENENLIDYFNAKEPNVHSEMLTVFINDLLKKNSLALSEIAAVSVSKGPGSFTGLRIGVSVAKGICYGLQIPLIGVNTLDAMAWEVLAHTTKKTCILMDAQNGQVYYGLYSKNNTTIIPTRVGHFDEEDLRDTLSGKGILITGVGVNKWADKYRDVEGIETRDGYYPDARFLVAPASQCFANKQFEDLADFEPYYIKDFVAKTGLKIKKILNR